MFHPFHRFKPPFSIGFCPYLREYFPCSRTIPPCSASCLASNGLHAIDQFALVMALGEAVRLRRLKPPSSSPPRICWCLMARKVAKLGGLGMVYYCLASGCVLLWFISRIPQYNNTSPTKISKYWPPHYWYRAPKKKQPSGTTSLSQVMLKLPRTPFHSSRSWVD